MRKAFTLIEVVAVLAILPFVTIALSRVFATFIRDVPRMTRVVERNTTVLDMIRQLRDDMDRATALPDTVEDRHSDDRTLLIGLPHSVICYQLGPGRAVRSVLSQDGQADAREERTWTFPDAVVTWSCWKQDETAEAVELHTLVKQRIGRHLKDKLPNSYVLFVGGMGKGGELR